MYNLYNVPSKTLIKVKERDSNGEVVAKNKKIFSDITKTDIGNRMISLNNAAVSLLNQIREYKEQKGIIQFTHCVIHLPVAY